MILHQLICRGVANFGTRCTIHRLTMYADISDMYRNKDVFCDLARILPSSLCLFFLPHACQFDSVETIVEHDSNVECVCNACGPEYVLCVTVAK